MCFTRCLRALCAIGLLCFQAAVSAATPDTGIWWNPAQSGRGFVIEVQGGTLFFGAFLYEANGRSTWYASSGPTQSNGSYQGVLQSYGNGQTLTGAYTAPTVTNPNAGNVTLQFSDASHGMLTWPGGTMAIERFAFSSGTPSFKPESGIWWNAAESGRGFLVEVQGSSLWMGGYMYDGSGNPVWYSTAGPMTSSTLYQGRLDQYSGGQTLTGAYQPPGAAANAGTVTLQFSGTTTATLTLPDARQIQLTRFYFGPTSVGEPQVVYSADGSASLTIPGGALPDGVKLSDIKVTKLAAADLGVTLNGQPPAAVYQLEPDGTQFKKPVSLTMTIAAAGNGVVMRAMLLPSAPNQAVQPLDTTAAFDAATGKTQVTANIPHFSHLVVHGGGRLTMTLPDHVEVGAPFAASATMSWEGNEVLVLSVIGRPDIVWRSTERRLTGDFKGTNVTPAQISNAPPEKQIGFLHTENAEFTCRRDGEITITYHVTLEETTYADPPYQPRSDIYSYNFTVTGTVACGPNRPPVVTQLKATLSAPVTTFTVTATDPDNDPLTFEWKMAGEACGTPRTPWTQSGQTVNWSHSDQSPDGCSHQSADHDVITSVTVSDGRGGSVQCTIVGTETQTINNPVCR